MSGPPSGSNVFQRQAELTESVWLSIGRAAETMGDLERAQKAYERVLSMNPLSWRALTQAAHVCRCREDYPRAVEYFNRAIQIDDKNGDIWSSLGHCFLMQDELQSAYNAYQNALFHLHSPKEDAKLWYGIGILYDRYGSLQHAEEAFSSVLRMDQNFEKADEIYFRLGIIYKQLQRYEESLKCFDQILRNPPHPLSQMDIWFQIGHVYEQQKDYEQAKDAWDRVLTEAPNHAKVLQQLGWLYHQSSAPFVNQEMAVQYLTRSLETDSSDAQSWYLLGRAYMTSQKYNKAYEAYQQAVYRDGRNPTFWISIGVLYFQINQFKDALDAYSRAIRLNPYISEVWFDLGSLYETCNQQIKDAMDAYIRAKELDPSNATVKERLDLLSKHMQDPSIPLGPAPPPKDVHPTAYSNFQPQPTDAPPPMRMHPNAPSSSSRHSPPRHGGFNGAGGPLPNGAYQPGSQQQQQQQRVHSRHGSPVRYGDGPDRGVGHPRGGGPAAQEDYRSRALPPPQDVEMSDARGGGGGERNYTTSRPSSALGHRGHPQYHVPNLPPPHHTQPSGPQTIPPILHHPQPQNQASNSYRGGGENRENRSSHKYGSSSRKRSSRSPSPGPLAPRVRGGGSPLLAPMSAGPAGVGVGGGGGGAAGMHQPSSAAGGHYGSYGPTSATRYGNGNLVERGRSPGVGASSASGGTYGPIVPGPSDADVNWDNNNRRSYPTGHHGHGGPLPPPDTRADRETTQYTDRVPPGVRIKEEPREKNVRLPPPPPLGGSQQQQQQQSSASYDAAAARQRPERRSSDDYEMRPPASAPGQYGQYDYDQRGGGGGGRGRSPHSAHGSIPPSQHRRYDPVQDRGGPPPPRQTSPFHPGPLRQPNDVSPVSHYDDRDRRRGPDEHPQYGGTPQDSPDRARRRSGRGEKDDPESGPEKGGSSRRRGGRSKKDKDHPSYGQQYGSQPASAFSAPPVPRSPGWQQQQQQGYPSDAYDSRNRSSGPQQHQRYPSSQANSALPPPLVPNRGINRHMDEDYDDPAAAADALMGLARAPASVASTATTINGPPASSASPPIMRPASQAATRKRRRSGSGSSTDHPPSTHSLLNNGSSNTEPEKKKARLDDNNNTPPPLISNARENSVGVNGRARPSLPRIHTREEEEQQREKEEGEKRGGDRDMMSPVPNNSATSSSTMSADKPGMNSILNGDKTSSPSPLRRAGTLQSAMESNSTSPPTSAATQDTPRNRDGSPTTPTRSKTLPPVASHSSSPPDKAASEEKRSHSHSHSRSASISNLTNGNSGGSP